MGTGDIVDDTITEDFSSWDGNVNCSANLHITLGDPLQAVTLSDGANVTLTARKAVIQPLVAVESDATLTIITRTLLNDTGIVDCGDGSSSNGLTCPLAGYPEQDAEHGRDIIHADHANGHAGFNFSKLDASGNPTSAASWSCIKDNVTGLTWEVKTNDGAICSGYNSSDSATFCNTQAYVARVNQAGWCGYSDWRLPTIKELEGIASYDRVYPCH